MTLLSNFTTPARAVVVGASGGIGHALVNRLSEEPGIEHIHALARSALHFPQPNIEAGRLDYSEPKTIAETAEKLASDGPLDIVIVATGILHRDPDIQPEKSMREIDAKQMADVLAINTVGPTLVAKHLLPLMRRDRRSVFAALSARVGSISDNRLGGWLSYRVSKTALNMALKTLSIEQARSRPLCQVVALHPGTVKTGLSQPFTSRTPDDKLFSADRAARQLLTVINDMPKDASDGFYAWDGTVIPY